MDTSSCSRDNWAESSATSILHRNLELCAYTPLDGGLDCPAAGLFVHLGVGTVSRMCSSFLSTGFPWLVSANTEPSHLLDGFLPYNRETTGSDEPGCTRSTYVAFSHKNEKLIQMGYQKKRFQIYMAALFEVASFGRGSACLEGLK